jgi:hypothetical protein
MKGYQDIGAGAWNGEIGPFLKEARKKRGLSLKEAERHTSIRWRYLEGLERENPAELPERSYVQGFLRSYADFLDLNVEELSRSLKRHYREHKRRTQRNNTFLGHRPSSPTEDPEAEDAATRRDGPRRGYRNGVSFAIPLIVLSLGLVVTALYLLQDGTMLSGAPADEGNAPVRNSSGGDGAGALTKTGGTTPTLEGEAEDAPPGRQGERMEVLLTVQGSESWISVESDSGVEYTGIAQPGFSKRFESRGTLGITTGNAGAVRVSINGLEYGTLGESGEVTSKSFTLKEAR